MSADYRRCVKRYPATDDTRRDVAAHLAERMGPMKSWVLAEEVADALGLSRTTAGQILTAMWDCPGDTEPVTVVERWDHSTNHRYRVEVTDAE
jgi:hypothetical protein